MCPYMVDGKKVRRVTEILGSRDCEATAYNENDDYNPRITHTVVLPGTLTHARIEQYEKTKLMGIPSAPLSMNPTDQRLLAKVLAEHKKQTKRNKQIHTTYMDIMETVKKCFSNYLVFVADHPYLPLLVEERVYSKMFNCGGTIDTVGLLKVKGYVIDDSMLPSNLPTKQYLKMCDHNGPCDCKIYDTVCLLDWKTSTRSQEGHRIQLSAYHTMLEENGYFDKWRAKGYMICWDTWSILLGEHGLKKTTTPYQLKHYDPHSADFLASCEVYDQAGYTTADLGGSCGLKGRCMFCSHILTCPDRLAWNLDDEELEFVGLSFPEIAQIRFLLQQNKLDSFASLRGKINKLYEKNKNKKEEREVAFTDVRNECEKELGIVMSHDGKQNFLESKE